MNSLTANFAPSEGRSGELQVLRGELRPLHSATGLVLGGMISGLAWIAIAFGCYLAY